jgi:protein-tyrosine phosphatase
MSEWNWRFVTLPGLFNFRDLGGYHGRDGRRVRTGRLYRADAPPHDSAAALRRLGVRSVLDLRREDEVERAGRVGDRAGCAYFNVHPGHDLADERLSWSACDPASDGGVARFLADRYLSMATFSITEFGAALRIVADPGNAPLVMHCRAGRDRTGVLAGLVLALLGVGDAAVAADFALSAEGMRRYYAWHRRTGSTQPLPPPHEVASPGAAMELFLVRLRERFGSIEQYAATAGVSSAALESLRTLMLEG